jgi:hypothetical protein
MTINNYVIPLKGQCIDMDILFEGLNILISTFCMYSLMVFKIFQTLEGL